MTIKNLEKMDSYNPTNYVNNSEPDIDADNLNKTENKLEETVAKANEIIDALKTLISTVQTNSDNTVPSSSLAYAMQQEITKNKEDIATANSNLAAANAKVALNGVKNINGFTAVYSDRTDRAFQLQYDSGEIASIAFNNTGIWYDFYDGQNWKQVWKFNKPT
jgi:hypothetical protein